MAAYSRISDFREVLSLFREMEEVNVKPNESVLVSAITACAHIGALAQGLWIHSYAKWCKFDSNPILATALVDMYSKCGCVELALSIFEGITDKGSRAWNAIISGVAMNGDALKSLQLFDEMVLSGIQPTEATFVSVLSACTHANLVDRGLSLFETMGTVFGVEPKIEHYACVVDLLARSGKLEEAEKFVEEKMGRIGEVDANVWGALLAACRIHGKVDIGKRVWRKLANEGVPDYGTHVLSYNMYKEAGWEAEAESVRRLIEEKRMKKIPGCSSIEVSHVVREGDTVNCTIAELQPLRAEAEDIPLDIVYEDEHLLVVNKAAHMVVHPAPGNATGTLVNGILHHCRLPTVSFFNPEVLSEADDASDDEFSTLSTDQDYNGGIGSGLCEAYVRPGIVHRLDKGTSGLLVVAKDENSHAHLAEQFKKHTIKRVYVSLTCGVPSPVCERIEIPIGRDLNNRLRMSAAPGLNTRQKARYAASRYKVIEILAHGGCALVEWRLETGRTHQIRAHAKYIGVPLLGDEVYGGTKSMALSLLQSRNPSSFHRQIEQLVAKIERPCLHALSLGFRHPNTGENLHFSKLPPADFAEILSQLRDISTEKVT
ncbi:RNA pseudouridylate synthase [Forsythia ovata]|uniref:RNA pseudouridylate synthase n=1 Tax=Forsythia ovata TaxID=205694 RepID=A0ABD1UB98_9LAMI